MSSGVTATNLPRLAFEQVRILVNRSFMQSAHCLHPLSGLTILSTLGCARVSSSNRLIHSFFCGIVAGCCDPTRIQFCVPRNVCFVSPIF